MPDPDTLAWPQEFVELLALKPDERVLDVGCGIGGGDFYMASKYGAFVHGVDLSVNMVTTALERAFAAKDGHKVSSPTLSLCAVKLVIVVRPLYRNKHLKGLFM